MQLEAGVQPELQAALLVPLAAEPSLAEPPSAALSALLRGLLGQPAALMLVQPAGRAWAAQLTPAPCKPCQRQCR